MAHASAAAIVSTFDAGHSYICCVGWVVSGPLSAVSQTYGGSASAANEFTSGANYDVDRIDLGLGNFSGSDAAVVSLWTESGGLPGLSLGSWAVGGLPLFGSTTSQIVTISGIGSLPLAAGSNYFVVIDAGGVDTWDAWNWNSVGATGNHLQKYADGPWTSTGLNETLGAFDILGKRIHSVPEPAPFSLFGMALAGFGAIRRRKLRA